VICGVWRAGDMICMKGEDHVRRLFRGLRLRQFPAALAVLSLLLVFAGAAFAVTGDDTPTLRAGATPKEGDESAEQRFLQLDEATTAARLAGDNPLDVAQAGAFRAHAANAARKLGQNPHNVGPLSFNSPWASIGPNPIVTAARSDNAFYALSGRIGALAIRKNGEFILGGAQGGIWTYDAGTGTWTPRTSDQDTQTIGALSVAPSNDSIIYAGTGEGALSGDSMYGNGILKSTDGGTTWSHVSGDYFVGVSISRVAVDPTNANHLYVSVLRGRGGARRVTPPVHSRFGIWESKDGGVSWTLLREVSEANGATDIEIDPLDHNVLYASFWGDAIYKSTDAGQTWTKIMNGFPAGANFAAAATRFSIAISHPSATAPAVLYAGLDWNNADGSHHVAEVFKSINAGASWSQTGTGTDDTDNVEDYCGTQCFYDNVIEVDPTNPNVVYAAGSFGYDLSPQSGGIFRSTDGGTTWANLGWDLHPDFHALAMDPTNPSHVLIGNDGGVWYSPDQGGRLDPSTQPLSDADWQDLNGTVDPNTAGVLHRTGLDLTQYSSIATDPLTPPGAASRKFWGGTQDNGTQRKSVNSNTWFDVAGGDGGQVLVDPTNPNFVYGTYFGISNSLYRFTNGGAQFFSNAFIQNGIHLSDRSDFYVPWVLNQNNPNQLFVGSYRMYRTDAARTSAQWNTISPDLTSGCTGTAPNGARTCAISAIGVGGGTAAYVGTLDGLVWTSPDAQSAATPTWTQIDTAANKLPNRPVGALAVDRSNSRVAYIGYNGYDEATPRTPGHIFMTTDGGARWTNISRNLPDAPVNSLVIDPSYPNTLYVGSDVGAFVTYDGGGHWSLLGSALPSVAVWQLDMDTLHRLIAAGTHGRGAFTVTDTNDPAPALVITKAAAATPVGPSSNLDYTITLKNIGNGPASGVTVTDPLPANTSFVSADSGGTFDKSTVTWTGLSVASGSSVTLHLTVGIADALKHGATSITNDGLRATSAEGPSATGSPVVTPLAPPFAMSVAPATQTDGAHAGSSVTYIVGITNQGFTTDSYTLASSGGTYPVSFLDSTCTTPATTTPTVSAGATTNVCVKVTVPVSGVNDGDISTATITATSVGSPSLTGTATVKTIAVTKDTLLVDNDGNGPDVQSYYSTALTTAGVSFATWDLATNPSLPLGYLLAHKNVYWFTGNSYPGPLTPYESELKALLDGGGRLFVSGQDLLDQAAGTTPFVHDYLHISWDGSEAQNDKATHSVTGVTGNPVTDGIATVPLDLTVNNATFMDEITPNGTATAAFKDDGVTAGTPQPDALTFAGTYKVVFLAFPFEEYGTAAQKADLMTRVKTFFAAP
jgi:uncharacterized repeat protein (TIGR01451 family)